MKSDFTSFIEANMYMQTGEHSGVNIICDYCKTQQNPSLEGGSCARQCSLPHNIALTSIHACLFLELFFLFCSAQMRSNLSLRNLFYSFWI